MVKYIYIVLISVFALSCTDLSDEMYSELPKEKFPEDEKQLQGLPAAAYKELGNLFDDYGWWFLVQEVSSDAVIFPQRGADWEDGGKWHVLNRHTWNDESAAVIGMWEVLYKTNVRCNQAFEVLKGLPETEVTKESMAQLTVLRAFIHYLLIDNYGDVPFVEKFKGSVLDPKRNTRSSVWHRLVSDVESSIELLPEFGTDKTRINKGSAHMLLAKLYLNSRIYNGYDSDKKSDMDKVIVNINALINSGSYSLEKNRLAPFFVNNESSSENIFTIPFDEILFPGFRINARTLHTDHQKTFNLHSTYWNGCCIMPGFYNEYFAGNDGYTNPDNAHNETQGDNGEVVDPRSNAFLRGQQYDISGNKLVVNEKDFILLRELKSDVLSAQDHGYAETRFSGYRMIKYQVKVGSSDFTMDNDFPVFRLSDAYLMRAEATLRGGAGADLSAQQDFDKIRNAANPNLQKINVSLKSILDERARELYLEGHRRQDLIRFGKFISKDWIGKVNKEDSRKTFMIPNKEINVNPNLKEPAIEL